MLYAIWYAALVLFAGWLFNFLRDVLRAECPTCPVTSAVMVTGLAVLVLVVVSFAARELWDKLRLLLQVKRFQRGE
jgi:hypothetical protein